MQNAFSPYDSQDRAIFTEKSAKTSCKHYANTTRNYFGYRSKGSRHIRSYKGVFPIGESVAILKSHAAIAVTFILPTGFLALPELGLLRATFAALKWRQPDNSHFFYCVCDPSVAVTFITRQTAQRKRALLSLNLFS